MVEISRSFGSSSEQWWRNAPEVVSCRGLFGWWNCGRTNEHLLSSANNDFRKFPLPSSGWWGLRCSRQVLGRITVLKNDSFCLSWSGQVRAGKVGRERLWHQPGCVGRGLSMSAWRPGLLLDTSLRYPGNILVEKEERFQIVIPETTTKHNGSFFRGVDLLQCPFSRYENIQNKICDTFLSYERSNCGCQ